MFRDTVKSCVKQQKGSELLLRLQRQAVTRSFTGGERQIKHKASNWVHPKILVYKYLS